MAKKAPVDDPDIHPPRETTIREFFGLTDAEVEMIECRAAIVKAIRTIRQADNLSQERAAAKVGVSQTRFSAIERGDANVSLDMMVEAFFALGRKRVDLADMLSLDGPHAAVVDIPLKRSPRAVKKEQLDKVAPARRRAAITTAAEPARASRAKAAAKSTRRQ